MRFIPTAGLSWPQIVEGAKTRSLDVIATAVKTDEREVFLNFTKIYLPTPLVIMVRSGGPAISYAQNLDGKRVALVKEYSASKRVKKEHPSIITHEVNSPLDGLLAVSASEADAYVGVVGISDYLIRKHGIGNIEVGGAYDMRMNGQRFGIRKDWPELVSILEKGLAAIPEAEKLAVLHKWSPIQAKLINPISLTNKEQNWLADHPKISIGVMNSWPPMDFVDDKGVPRGIGVSTIKALNNRFGGMLKIVPGPWNKIYEATKAGRLDALMGITPRKDREAFFSFTKPYIKVPHVIFANSKSDIQYNDLKDFTGKTVAIEEGFFIADVLKRDHQTAKVKLYKSTRDALYAVSKGDADVYVGNRAVALYIIEHELLSNLHEHGAIVETSSINAIGIRKDWPILRDILQKGLDSLSNKEWRGILQEWVKVKPQTEIALHLTDDEKSWLATHQKLRLGLHTAWAPFEFINAAGLYRGISADFISLLNERLGIEMIPGKAENWTEVMKGVHADKIDLLPTVMKTPALGKHLYFTKPYQRLPMVILAHKDAPLVDGLDGLAGKKIGVIQGHASEFLLSEKHTNIQRVQFPNIEQALTALSDGDIDAYMDNIPAITYAVQQSGLDNLRVISSTPYHTEISFGVSKALTPLVPILNKAIASIPEVEKQAINRSWLSARIESRPDFKYLLKVIIFALLIGGTILGVILFWNRRLAREIEERKNAQHELKQTAPSCRAKSSISGHYRF